MEIISNRESSLEFDAMTMSPVEPGVADEGVRFRTHKVIIENIWKNEFNGIYLSKLDNKVNDLLNGKDTAFNRLGSNPAAIRGLKEGSRIHVAASIIVQRGGSTSTETSIFGDEVGYQSLIQKDLIEAWSRHNDCWVDNSTTYLENKYGKIVGYGSESRVFKDGEYAVKEWKVDRYESLQLALDRVTDALMTSAECGFPYEGAKEKYILDIDLGEEARRIDYGTDQYRKRIQGDNAAHRRTVL